MQVNQQLKNSSGSTLVGFVIVVAVVFLAFNLVVLVN
jgi:hypothetical protein